MTDKKNTTRRSGEALTRAIYTAALDILNTAGFEKVTFANVARQAETARTVLYKRWDSPFAMLFDAVQYFSHDGSDDAPAVDFTGHTLRENLISIVNHFHVSNPFMRALLFELGRNSPEVQKIFEDMRQQELFYMERVLSQAQLTGEIKHTVTDYVKLMPFNLVLYQAIISQTDLTPGFGIELVDSVVLPAIMAQQN
ncbi:TetR/AcrR family transcriptional regulator [Periweissella cryptocerci]|uniref:TetR/AcrR family transcriptional regulator n=1 Tax=Periweissella cryptocerci TaxID=2506420 RepID=A0A4P6YXA6_9LACO|nr:TetR/AcrR family transcriptional regulator [Periweissella cryptocerci]